MKKLKSGFIQRSLFLVIFCTCLNGFSQQQLLYTHYMHNALPLNPAYAGTHESLSVSALIREQWVGVEGAPNTQILSAHGTMGSRPVSLGGVLYRDNLGISTELGAFFSTTYRIRITEQLRLSMGLQFSGHNFMRDYSEVQGENRASMSEFQWNVGTGLMLHSDRFYFGLSSPQMMERKLEINDADGQFSSLVRHYYLNTGYAFDVNRDLILKPNMLVKAVGQAPVQVDANLNALIKQILWLGVSYRSLESLAGIVGFQVTPQFLVSYSYDASVNEIDRPSHEIMINYQFSLPSRKIITPRYF